ncbi:hypothetical protein [Terriglobus roseus]|nr:hypothetical protein [Terriglobus roseus]
MSGQNWYTRVAEATTHDESAASAGYWDAQPADSCHIALSRTNLSSLRSDVTAHRAEMIQIRVDINRDMTQLRDSIHRDTISLRERVAVVEAENT